MVSFGGPKKNVQAGFGLEASRVAGKKEGLIGDAQRREDLWTDQGGGKVSRLTKKRRCRSFPLGGGRGKESADVGDAERRIDLCPNAEKRFPS